MASTEAQKRASSNYRRNNVKQITLAFYPDDWELYEWVSEKPKRIEFIRQVLRERMQQERRTNTQ